MYEALWDLENRSATAPRTPERDDAGLIGRLRDGDAVAFEELYRRHSRWLYGLAFRLTCDRGEAEELAQEVFVRSWESRTAFRNSDHFRRWLRRVAVNSWINDLRRRRTAGRSGLSTVPPSDDRTDDELEIAVPAAAPGARLDLESALARLTPRLRAVVLLFDLYGLAHHEIAELLEMTPGASKVQLHRARTRLREMLQ